MTKTSLPQYYLIKVRSILSTIYHCLKVIGTSYINPKASFKEYDKIIQGWVQSQMKIIKTNINVINPHHVKPETNKRYIIMSNHTSAYDIPLCYFAFPKHSMRMLAKKELSKIPIFGRAMQKAGFPFVDRKNRQQAIKDLKNAQALMDLGVMLWIAPEGTRSKDGQLKAFKKGGFITAIETNAQIIPLTVKGAFDLKPKGKSEILLNHKVDLIIGEPIDGGLYTLDQKKQLIDTVHATMEKTLNSYTQAT